MQNAASTAALPPARARAVLARRAATGGAAAQTAARQWPKPVCAACGEASVVLLTQTAGVGFARSNVCARVVTRRLPTHTKLWLDRQLATHRPLIRRWPAMSGQQGGARRSSRKKMARHHQAPQRVALLGLSAVGVAAFITAAAVGYVLTRKRPR